MTTNFGKFSSNFFVISFKFPSPLCNFYAGTFHPRKRNSGNFPRFPSNFGPYFAVFEAPITKICFRRILKIPEGEKRLIHLKRGNYKTSVTTRDIWKSNKKPIFRDLFVGKMRVFPCCSTHTKKKENKGTVEGVRRVIFPRRDARINQPGTDIINISFIYSQRNFGPFFQPPTPVKPSTNPQPPPPRPFSILHIRSFHLLTAEYFLILKYRSGMVTGGGEEGGGKKGI